MNPTIRIEPIFGRIEVEGRMRLVGDSLIGEGRVRHFDGKGVLIKDTGWEPNGVVVTPCRWWEVWK